MLASIVVLVAFFLPWVQACGVEMSGYEIASDQSGFIANNWIYWSTLVAGVGGLLLPLAAGNQKASAAARIVLGAVGALPLLNIMANMSRMVGGQPNSAAQAILDTIRVGGWLTLVGLAGIILSGMIDLGVVSWDPPDSS